MGTTRAGGPGPNGGKAPGPGNTGSTGGGQVGGGNGNTGGTTGGGGGILDQTAAGPTPLRRLDRREYNNTVRDLLGDNSSPADKFPVRPPGRLQLPARRHRLDAGLLDGARRRRGPGRRRQRDHAGPLHHGERHRRGGLRQEVRHELRPARLPAPADHGRGGQPRAALPGGPGHGDGRLRRGHQDHARGRSCSRRLPVPLGERPGRPVLEGKVIKLGDYENASHLSYFLWGTMPDQALFDLAAANKLGTPAELEAQARRMLGDRQPARPWAHSSRSGWGSTASAGRQKDTDDLPRVQGRPQGGDDRRGPDLPLQTWCSTAMAGSPRC